MVKDFVAERSKVEGFPRTRLVLFTQEEIEHIRGTSDFIALNHYTTYYAANDITVSPPTEQPSSVKDSRVSLWQDEEWPSGAFSEFRVTGFM